MQLTLLLGTIYWMCDDLLRTQFCYLLPINVQQEQLHLDIVEQHLVVEVAGGARKHITVLTWVNAVSFNHEAF